MATPLRPEDFYSKHGKYPKLPEKGLVHRVPDGREETPLREWEDLTYTFNNAADTFRICFQPAKHIAESLRMQTLTPTVEAAFNEKEKLIYIEFQQASKTLGCHLLRFPDSVDGWHPCTLRWQYSEEEDALDIDLVSEQVLSTGFRKNEQAQESFELDIIFDQDAMSRYLSIEILNAANLLAN
ncbi:hypothetical protein QOT17_024952 [Balamuthia mandrillaris]